MREVVVALALVLALAPAACDGPADPAAPETTSAAWPEGTALAVDGRPILAQEILAEAARLRRVYPARSERYLRSQALSSFVLPREALRSAYPEARLRALDECEALRARLVAGEDPAALGAREVTAGPEGLTLHLWDAGRALVPGVWSEPIERLGFWSLVQRVERPGPPLADPDVLTLRALHVAYTPLDFAPATLDEALAAAHLEIVDPAWDDVVPELLRYRMRGAR